jgi:hypothetical protein
MINLHKAWEGRDRLNEKMSRLLLQHLQADRLKYLALVEDYSPETMAKYGQATLDLLDHKIATMEALIAEKFT